MSPEARVGLGLLAALALIFGTILIAVQVEAGVAKECVRSGQQWIDDSCVRK